MNLKDILSKEEIVFYFKSKTYKNNEIIENEDFVCDNIGFIIEGNAKIVSCNELGRENIIQVLNNNDFYGNNIIFNELKYLGNIISIGKTVVAKITKNDFFKLCLNKPLFLEEYLKVTSMSQFNVYQKLKLFSINNLSDRLMYYFHYNNINNIVYIGSITKLAEIMSFPRPSVSRVLTILEKQGKIIKKNRCIEILENI